MPYTSMDGEGRFQAESRDYEAQEQSASGGDIDE